MSKSLDPDQDRHLVSSDLGQSGLQRLSVYDTSMQRGICSWRLLEKSFLSPDICRCRLLKWVSLSVFLAIRRFIDVYKGFRETGNLPFFFLGCGIYYPIRHDWILCSLFLLLSGILYI